MRRIILSTVIFSILVCCGTAEEETTDVPPESSEPDTLTVSPVDSIGILMGDSNYVFGTITDAIILDSGNIVIVDEASRSAMMYDPSGDFIRRIAREGSGPGELIVPGGLVRFSDNTIGILDHGQGVNRYSPEGDFIELMTDFQGQSVPQWAWGVNDMGYVGAFTSIAQTEEGLEASFLIARWDSLAEHSVEYFSNSFLYQPERSDEMLKNTLFSASFTASEDGAVYVAPTSSENYLINIHEPDGSTAGTIERDLPRVEKSQEELAEETAMIEAMLRERGVPEHMIMYQPDPYRWMIQPQGMSVDGRGRLWARSGTAPEVLMDVYSPQGEHLAVLRIEGVTQPGTMDFLSVKAQKDRLLVYSLQAPDYPKLYLVDIPAL